MIEYKIDAENFETLTSEPKIAPAGDTVQIAMPKTHWGAWHREEKTPFPVIGVF